MSDSNILTKYPRRPHSDNSGKDYEVKITALLTLQLIKNCKKTDFWVASNVDHVGDFDDIVICQISETQTTMHLIQVKYQDHPKPIARGEYLYKKKGKAKKNKDNFSLHKYSSSYNALKEKLNAESDLEIIQHFQKAKDRLHFILFTNRGTQMCDFLSNLNCETLETLENFNTSTKRDSLYAFNTLLTEFDNNFLNRFIVFTNQVHCDKVDEFIRKEIELLVGTSNINLTEASDKFVTFIKSWIETADVAKEKIFPTLVKKDAINILTYNVLKPFICLPEKFPTQCLLDVNVWDEIIADKSIILVDTDEEVEMFLNEYVGRKVACYASAQYWQQDLAKDPSYFKKFSKLNMLRFSKSITLLDVYKCLWFNGDLPLVIKISRKGDLNVIRKVFRLSKLRVIVLNTLSELVRITDIPQHFCDLKNLSHEERLKILECRVNLQGRSGVTLGELVDKPMYNLIKCNHVIKILLGIFNIGHSYNLLEANIMSRSVTNVALKYEVLNISEETFVVHYKGERTGYEHKQNIIFSLKDNYDIDRHAPPVHRVVWHDGFLIWKESVGSTKNIRYYQMLQPEDFSSWYIPARTSYVYDNVPHLWTDWLSFLETCKKFVLIVANPGMGKTVLLDCIAKEAPGHIWIVKIDLKEHYEHFKGRSGDSLNYFNDFLLKQDCIDIDLAKAIFAKLLKNKKVLVLLDGFDEVVMSYKDDVTQIIEDLKHGGLMVWVTTRPVMSHHLQNKFDVFPTTLRPFSREDQKMFLFNYYKHLTKAPEGITLIETFIEGLLDRASDKLEANDRVFIETPLHTKLLANVFKKDCEIAVAKGLVEFNKDFDLLYLYEEFLKEKTDIMFEKFGPGMKDSRIFYEEHQKLFALKSVFHEPLLENLNLKCRLQDYYEDNHHRIQVMQKEGIVVVSFKSDENNENKQFSYIEFIHRTCAEYLSAQWLFEQWMKNPHLHPFLRALCNERFKNVYDFLFNVFDRLIAKNCTLHMAIIKGQIAEAVDMVKCNPNAVKTVDAAGRNAIHLMGLYGKRHPLWTRKVNPPIDNMAELLRHVPQDGVINQTDQLMHFTPLDYAFANTSLKVANTICEKFSQAYFEFYLEDKEALLKICGSYEYQTLFYVLLRYFVSREILLKQIQPDMSIRSYFWFENNKFAGPVLGFGYYSEIEKLGRAFVDSDCYNTIYQYVKELRESTLWELFESVYVGSLYFAAAFDTVDNLRKFLVPGIEVNKADRHLNTPLHYACIQNRIENISELLLRGADLNKAGCEGNTALHRAAQTENILVLQQLLIHGVDVNVQNNAEETPLHLAVHVANPSVIRELCTHQADVNFPNRQNETPLHVAVHTKNYSVIRELLNHRADTNYRNNQGKTPLHIAAYVGDTSILQELLKHGTNINFQDNEGETPLHVATKIGNPLAVQELLNYRSDVNIQNNEGKTPLHTAAIVGKPLVLQKLLEKPLPVAIQHSDVELLLGSNRRLVEVQKPMIQMLLDKGACVNTQDMNGYTPLHYFCEHRMISWDKDEEGSRFLQSDITRMFLEKNVDVNIANKCGYTPLDIAIHNNNDEIVTTLKGHLEKDILQK